VIVNSSTSTTMSAGFIPKSNDNRFRKSSTFVMILSESSIRLLSNTTLFLKYDIRTLISASLNCLTFSGVNDLGGEDFTDDVGYSTVVSLLLITILLFTVFVFVFVTLDSLLYFNSKFGRVILESKNKLSFIHFLELQSWYFQSSS
jgi:hypothetical protein